MMTNITKQVSKSRVVAQKTRKSSSKLKQKHVGHHQTKHNPTINEKNPWYNCFTKEDELYNSYMSKEWSFEIRNDDQALFENLCLEGAQAGLSWKTILYKREAYRKLFHGFNIAKVSQMTTSDIDHIMQIEASATTSNLIVVKHRGKLESIVHNAKQLLLLSETSREEESYSTFSDYLWSFVNDKPILNHWKKIEDIPSKTDESEQMSKALKSHGFKFVGPTTCYSLMQSCGFVIDHPVGTPEWEAALKRLKSRDGGYQNRKH